MADKIYLILSEVEGRTTAVRDALPLSHPPPPRERRHPDPEEQRGCRLRHGFDIDRDEVRDQAATLVLVGEDK